MNEVTSQFFRLFNDEQDFYECHEIFELAWKAASDPHNIIFYKALVQVATAQFKLRKGVLRGVRKLFDCAAPELAKLPSVYQGIDIERLRQEFQQQVNALPPIDRIDDDEYREYGLTLLRLYRAPQ
jgi:predicted metal-dependent hydrolase